jgi:universal stress protein E
MSPIIRTLVAGVAHPSAGDPTLGAAAALARATGAALHLVHAFDLPAPWGPPEMPFLPPDRMQFHLDEQREALEAAAARIEGVSVTCHPVAGAPGPALLDVAASVHADAVVVGAARHGRVATAFLGTTAQRVLRGATVPVLVVRRPVCVPAGRVLLTTDLSPMSAAVHEAGLDAVEALLGPPEAVRSLAVVWYPAVPVQETREGATRMAMAALGRFLDARATRAMPVQAHVRLGEPAAEIAAEAAAWHADLVVVGTHARGWAGRLALGSVAEAALRDCPCNVLALPPRALPAWEDSEAGETAAAGAG